jgi:hypothetical protein
MKSSANALFNKNYQLHLKHLKLKGLQPKTIEVCNTDEWANIRAHPPAPTVAA